MAENYALIPEASFIYTPINMKESRDISKNLMSGDFERHLRDVMAQKTDRRWKSWLITLGVVVGALVAWMLVFTVVREVQLRQIRQEVDELTANVIALSANVKSLTQKIEKSKILEDIKDLQEQIDADENTNGKEVIKEKSYSSLDKLHGLTVLEDDQIGDDEDLLDTGDDAESGDWYPDYDKREHIGSTNMVHLRPQDMVSLNDDTTSDESDAGISFRTDGDNAVLSNIREIKRRLNENPEDPDLELKLKTVDPDPKRVELYSEEMAETIRKKRSVFPDSATDSVDDFAAPRVIAKSDTRRTSKKYTANGKAPTSKMALHTISRTIRNSDYEEGVRRPFVAAHFHGNTSHLNTEIHEHYKGNGLVRVSHGAPHDVWYPAPWTAASPHPRPTLTRNGHVHVHHTGVYLVYVQIYYLDNHDIISWVLHRTNPEIDGRETILQCAQSTHSTDHSDKPNSCFSAAAIFLKTGDRLAVRNTGGDRHSLMQPEKSFIGLIKLADAEDPTEEL